MYRTRVGVDLAKKVIQVCIYRNKKVQSNIEMTPEEFLSWLINNKPVTIIFEACSSSNYWKQKAIEAGHDARLVSAKLVSVVRQNQKTDKNDALAIVQKPLCLMPQSVHAMPEHHQRPSLRVPIPAYCDQSDRI